MNFHEQEAQKMILRLSNLALLIFSCLITAAASASGNLLAEISKSGNSWTLAYTTESPAQQLAFKRNPDHSRADRWTPASKDFQITREGGTDFVRRLDGQPFSEVTFYLTPSYTPLPKDYAPFSPFSDGGVLIHSGRFFACPDRCEDTYNKWRMALVAPESDTIVLNGSTAQGRVEWLDSDAGRKIYIGPQRPVDDETFVSIVDPGLPDNLKSTLHQSLPRLAAEYAKFLKPPTDKPMLFASYDKAHRGGHGRQGGVLPNQTFMHWYGERVADDTDEWSILWFFAHEVAHLYQAVSGRIEPEHAWIHEGAAEYMAGLIMKSLIPESSAWVDARFTGVLEPCLNGLGTHSLAEAAERQQHRLYYTCGLLIHHAIAREAQVNGEPVNFFRVWSAFQEKVAADKPASADVFMNSLRPFVPEVFFHNLTELVMSRGSGSAPYIHALVAESQSPLISNIAPD